MVVMLISMSFLFPMLVDSQHNENIISLPDEVLSKCDRYLISEFSQNEEDGYYDVLVGCDPLGTPNYAERCVESVDRMTVEKNWNKFHIFETNLTKGQISDIAMLPFVTRIDYNLVEGIAGMNDARYYTEVSALQYYIPSLDGNKDGSASYSKDDIVIAILDTGIDEGHYDLGGGKVIGWHDYINGNNEEPYDDEGHGTHCASIAAGSGDATYIYRGVAPGAALVGVKIIDATNHIPSKSVAIDGLGFVADNKDTYGIEIASCSWGFWDDFGAYDTVAQAADSLVHDYGIVVCAIAGNKGIYGSDTIESPGTAKWVITVGNAVDPGEGGWSLDTDSSRGPCDDGRNKPDILAPGTNIMAARVDTANQYWEKSGTSAACPFVAGLVALFLDYDDELASDTDADNNPDIKQLLMASAVDVPGDTHPGLDNNYGAGRVDALKAYQFLTNDVSEYTSDAYLAISYQDTTWNWVNEPMWSCDPNYGNDFYKVYIYSDWFLCATAYGDPDLVIKVRIYDKYGYLVATSTAGRVRTVGYWSTYSGVYYFSVWVQNNSGDRYDISITTTPS
jgi:serine protease AprX